MKKKTAKVYPGAKRLKKKIIPGVHILVKKEDIDSYDVTVLPTGQYIISAKNGMGTRPLKDDGHGNITLYELV